MEGKKNHPVPRQINLRDRLIFLRSKKFTAVKAHILPSYYLGLYFFNYYSKYKDKIHCTPKKKPTNHSTTKYGEKQKSSRVKSGHEVITLLLSDNVTAGKKQVHEFVGASSSVQAWHNGHSTSHEGPTLNCESD